MKLTVELRDERFHYEWQIGESRHSASAPLDADTLEAFVDVLRGATVAYRRAQERKEREMMRKHWSEQE